MRRLIVLAAVLTITAARPETYREKEDFQYSRSSSDQGSKSGYYGAQRGNMGGNYERAHNMDTLAQHQMSGLVRQTQGELGDGANQRSGSVFTSANSQGMYGTGQYDLSHVQGRNFQEGVSFASANANSRPSHNSGSTGQIDSSVFQGGYDSSNAYDSRYRGYSAAKNSNQMLYANNQHHSADDLQSANQQQSRYESQGTGYNSQSGYHRESGYNQANYDSSNRYGSNVHNRLVGATMPVRVVVRPGTIVTVPVAAQAYDASQSSSAFDHNAINTEAEALSGRDEHSVYRPSNKGKHYESSYSYRKEWEKHDTQPAGVPLSIPTVSPYPKNSELYEDTLAHNSERQQAASSVDSHKHSSYNVEAASSSQSRHQAGYNSQHHSTATNADSSAYRTGEYNNAALNQVLNSQVEDISTKPKSYQSSYSYHKSWERQGDPYVIIPTTNDNAAAQKLVTSHRGAYGDTHQYGSHHHYNTNQQRYIKIGDEDRDCDENGQRITRVARSVDFENQQQEDLTQQTQSQWEDLGQHSQNLEDLGQQTQNLEFTQQSQNKWDKTEDLGQRTQDLEFTQQNQNKWDKYENLGQQTQNRWSPQTTGQQTEQLGFQVEDLGQQTQNQWTQHETEHKPNWNTLELEPQSQTGTLQIENKYTTPTLQTVQKEDTSKPDNSKITGGNNWDIHISNADKGNVETHPVGNPGFQGVNINGYHNWNQMSDNLGQQIQDIIWKMNNSMQQTQSNNFYGYDSNDKQSFDYAHNAQSHNNYWHVAEHSGSSDIDKYLDSSNSFQSHDSHPIPSIWDKLDSIEKQSNNAPGTHDLNVDYTAPVGPNKNIEESEHTEKTSTQKIETTSSKIAKPTVKPKDNVNDINKVRPQDIGRGDIGPEDVLNTVTTSQPHSTTNTKLTNIGNTNISKQITTETILNEKKNSSDNLEQSTQNEQNYEQSNKFEQQASNFGQRYPDFGQHSTNFEQQSTNFEQQSNNFDQQSTNFEQHSTDFEQQQSNNFEQQSTNLEDSSNFEQQSSDFEQQQSKNLEDSSNFGQQSTNFEQQSTNFEQQTNNFEQQSNNFEQQSNNFEQQSNNFEQQSNNFEQQPNFGQQSNNFEQQSTNLENSHNFVQEHLPTHHSSNFEQQHLPKYEQHSSNFEHNLPTYEQRFPSVVEHSLNAEQHPTNFGQSLENMEQQAVNFEQQSDNMEQQAVNFEQQSDNMGQEAVNVEQQSDNMEHQTGNFEQQSDNMQQQAVNFEQQSDNMGQQPVNFEQQSDNMEQQAVNFGQQLDNMEQQAVNFEQQSDNMEQQAVNFEQQSDNFEQQLGTFEQQSTNIEPKGKDFLQQSLPLHKNKDFEIEEKVEKQVSKPLYNEQGQQNERLDNLDQEMHKEWEPMDLQHSQNIGMFSPVHDIPENVDQKRNSELVVPVEPAVTESTPESVTEKGFWNKVSNKFSRAKDKVKSWFSK